LHGGSEGEVGIEQIRQPERPEYIASDDHACALALDTPEKYVSYYRQWQVDMRFELEDAKESGMASAAVHRIEQSFQKMLRIWSLNVEAYEGNWRWMVQHMLPPDGEQSWRWRKTAEVVLERMEMKPLVELRERLNAYVLEMEEIDKERQYWTSAVGMLLSESQEKPSSWASAAEMHLKIGGCVANVERLAEREWTTVKQLAVTWASSLGDFNAAVCNVEAEPYMPNWVAISSQIVKIALERGLLKQCDDSNDKESTDGRKNAAGENQMTVQVAV
jgi:hypothetical protein